MVWENRNMFPQVIFKIFSPGNRRAEMNRKFPFCEKCGAREYYVYDPDRNQFEKYIKGPDGLDDVLDKNEYVSPQLQIKFDMSGPELLIYRPNGERFLTFTELAQQAEAEQQRADELAVKLRELGVDTNTL
jgi:Uma2 family endonuclease